jgi:phosphoglycerate dehydrogenase-like enzyme
MHDCVSRNQNRNNPYRPTLVDSRISDCDVFLGHVNPEGLARAAPRLKWAHLTSAGVDHVLQSDLLEHGQIVVTNSSGTSAPWIGEYRRHVVKVFRVDGGGICDLFDVRAFS